MQAKTTSGAHGPRQKIAALPSPPRLHPQPKPPNPKPTHISRPHSRHRRASSHPPMKRAAEKQLTRDDVEAATDETAAENPAHFERAAPDVLAKRRILKVRRTAPTQPPSAAAAKPNPFASLQLPKPSVSTAAQPASEPAPGDKVEDAAAAKTPDIADSAPTGEQQPKPDDAAPPQPKKQKTSAESAPVEKPSTAEHKSPAPTAETPHSAQGEADLKKDEKPQREEGHSADKDPGDKSVSTAAPPVSTASASQPALTEQAVDGQTSKSDDQKPDHAESKPVAQNGTDAAKSQPDNIAEKDADVKATAAATDSKPASLNVSEAVNGAKPFTKLGSKPAIIFGSSASDSIKSFATAAKVDGSFKFNSGGAASPSSNAQSHEFKEQPVTSGEEDEETLFRTRTKLYSLEGESDKMRWRECGVGALKMNQHKGNKRVRLLMRSEGVLRVILNTPLHTHVKLDRATERSIRFQGYDQRTSKCYLLRFATRDACAEFIAAVDKWKESEEK
ncbi:NUP50 (Nucleoporin 50 kDa) [Gracilaria domingensis]|nr:NUP50 (Nucleoporin 50 kDa) [Gracilaria domingensis]